MKLDRIERRDFHAHRGIIERVNFEALMGLGNTTSFVMMNLKSLTARNSVGAIGVA